MQYTQFQKLAQNNKLTDIEKIGFGKGTRKEFENAILKDISDKLSLSRKNLRLLDIGCGASNLTNLLIDLCESYEHELVLVDSSEMLSNIKPSKCLTKIEGFFPHNIENIQRIRPTFDCILSYSVLQYIFVDTNIFCFFDSVMSLLKEEGRALIGDIPNASMLKRFLSSNQGVKYHKKFMKTTNPPIIKHQEIDNNLINDSVLLGVMQRIRSAGLQSYLLPLSQDLYYSNRREDILIHKF